MKRALIPVALLCWLLSMGILCCAFLSAMVAIAFGGLAYLPGEISARIWRIQ
jgi:hypothetical protein